MKKILFILAAASLVLTSCSGSQAHDERVATFSAPVDSVVKPDEAPVETVKQRKTKLSNLWTTQAVEAQIRACFAEVNRMAAGEGVNVEVLDSKYCSKDFLELKTHLSQKVQKGEVEFQGDEGYHWTADIATPIIVDSVKAELLSREQAQAEVWLKDEHDKIGYLELALYLEDGAWKIHNWIDTDLYPFGALFYWMQNAYDGTMDDADEEE